MPGQIGKKRVSVKDIAKVAGVSDTTVVHALNPPPNVRMKKETRDKVLSVAAELGYKPNFMGRALVRGRTFTIGLLQPSYESVLYVFYQKFVQAMAREMEKDDCHLLMLFRNPGRGYMKVVEEGRLDGMFVLQSDSEDEHIREIEKAGLPTVVINRPYKSPDPKNNRIACVHSDYDLYMREAVDELVAAGAKSILCVLERDRGEPNRLLFNAFWNEAERRSSQGTAFSHMTGTMDRRKTREQMRNSLCSGNRFDGVIANGAWVAGIYIEEAAKVGLAPGRDFNIVFDDVPGAHEVTGGELASYLQQPELIGEGAWELMKGLIEGKSRRKELVIPYKRAPISE